MEARIKGKQGIALFLPTASVKRHEDREGEEMGIAIVGKRMHGLRALPPRLYNLPRQEIRKRLMPLLTLNGLRMPNRGVGLRALELYEEQPVDFEEALAVAHMEQQGIQEIFSNDRDFDRFPQVARIEP